MLRAAQRAALARRISLLISLFRAEQADGKFHKPLLKLLNDGKPSRNSVKKKKKFPVPAA